MLETHSIKTLTCGARCWRFGYMCSATIWMGRRRRSGMHFDGRGRLMIVAARQCSVGVKLWRACLLSLSPPREQSYGNVELYLACGRVRERTIDKYMWKRSESWTSAFSVVRRCARRGISLSDGRKACRDFALWQIHGRSALLRFAGVRPRRSRTCRVQINLCSRGQYDRYCGYSKHKTQDFI